jgi:hypothetical protein
MKLITRSMKLTACLMKLIRRRMKLIATDQSFIPSVVNVMKPVVSFIPRSQSFKVCVHKEMRLSRSVSTPHPTQGEVTPSHRRQRYNGSVGVGRPVQVAAA